MLKNRLIVSGGIVLAAGLLACHTAQAGVSYADPAGGWRYSYAANPFIAGTVNSDCVGGVCPAGYGLNQLVPDALDGTWSHNQGDKWDGSAPGDPLGDYHAPPADPINNPRSGNQGPLLVGRASLTRVALVISVFRTRQARRYELCRYIVQRLRARQRRESPAAQTTPSIPIDACTLATRCCQDGTLTDELILTNTGVTLSFRARIPGMDQASGLDDIYQQDTDMDGNLNVTPWFQDAPHGRSAPMLNGRGTINVVQNAPDNDGYVGRLFFGDQRRHHRVLRSQQRLTLHGLRQRRPDHEQPQRQYARQRRLGYQLGPSTSWKWKTKS